MTTLVEGSPETYRVAAGPEPGGSAAELRQRILERTAVVAVVGLGYVGLPLAVAYAEAGFRVVGLDVDARRVATLNRGESPIADIDSGRLAALVGRRSPAGLTVGGAVARAVDDAAPAGPGRPTITAAPAATGIGTVSGSFQATTDFDAIAGVDAVIICVPTPLGRAKEPDLTYIVEAVDQVARRAHPGMLVVLESTTYPGTTEDVVVPALTRVDQDGRPLVVGRDVFIAFSPERIDPGREDWTVATTPKVVGGFTPSCLEVARALYQTAVQRVVPVSHVRTAEMVKLLENTFRATNIALINEMAVVCGRLGIDVWEVIDAAKTKPFGFMPFYPGPGLGGHCIPIDPEYLAWKMRTLNFHTRFISLASEINQAMPGHVVSRVSDALNSHGRAVRGARVLILGVAYKADVNDVRESPSLELLRLLGEKGADVSYHDPLVPSLNLDGRTMTSVALRDTLDLVDCVVIATAHSSYDWQEVVDASRCVVDTRNATQHVVAPAGRVVKL